MKMREVDELIVAKPLYLYSVTLQQIRDTVSCEVSS